MNSMTFQLNLLYPSDSIEAKKYQNSYLYCMMASVSLISQQNFDDVIRLLITETNY